MKYFCVSDIHSHYDELITALNKANFDPLNDDHKLIVIGDLFDRGNQTVEVLEYLYNLYRKDKAIIIMGNHDVFLLDFLFFRFERTVFNFNRNGHQKTIEQLLGREIDIDSDFVDEAQEIELKFPYIRNFISSFKSFYEIDEYFLVHGGVDATKEDFRNDELRTFVWTRMIDTPRLKDRIMVVGHTPAYYIRCLRENMDYHIVEGNPEQYQEYYDCYDEGDIIHIDGGVYSGGRINVFIIEK